MDEQSKKPMKLARRFRAGRRLTIALALLCWSTIIVGVESQVSTPSAGTLDELAVKGKHLRAEFDAKYKELRTKKALARENDITPIVLKYLSPSMSIEDVTRVLRSAGFGEPGVTVDGHLFFSMRVGGFLSFRMSR
jgi:hypothetical protein